ncbi:unknown protein [Seminavis robusta]|uniref:Uncharacterized protein n=1 Tax=Seminavis robusta TaxID=568900 RepID=A0A9N8DFZ7_9STRA|nr:unknown protein [Seminavis robusta]|eukprot:Sro125_g060350.1 n/a (107) ;mRNA; r:86093-86413
MLSAWEILERWEPPSLDEVQAIGKSDPEVWKSFDEYLFEMYGSPLMTLLEGEDPSDQFERVVPLDVVAYLADQWPESVCMENGRGGLPLHLALRFHRDEIVDFFLN